MSLSAKLIWLAVSPFTSATHSPPSQGANPDIMIPTSSNLVNTPMYPLAWAAHDGRTDLVKLMVESSTPANVNAKDGQGQTALHAAATCDFRLSSDSGAAATAAYLIQKGANPLAKDNSGKTPFDLNPGKKHNCNSTYSDGSDCPMVSESQ